MMELAVRVWLLVINHRVESRRRNKMRKTRLCGKSQRIGKLMLKVAGTGVTEAHLLWICVRQGPSRVRRTVKRRCGELAESGSNSLASENC